MPTKIPKGVDFLETRMADMAHATWKLLYEKYGRIKVNEAANRLACGCPFCVEVLLEREVSDKGE